MQSVTEKTINAQPTLEAKRELIREYFLVSKLDRYQATQELLKLGYHVDAVSTFIDSWMQELRGW